MRICVLTHTFPRFPGDTISSIFMAELAQSLVDAGNEVWVLIPYTPLFKETKKEYHVVTYKYVYPESLHKLGYSETLTNDMGFPLLMWLLSPLMYAFCFFKLLYLIKREKIDIISAHWILPNGFIAGFASFLTGVPVVSTLPGSDVYMVKKNPFFNLMGRLAVWWDTYITSNSPQLIADLEKSTRSKLGGRSSAIVYGAGSANFRPDKISGKRMRKSLGFSSRQVVILGVGRLVAKKGFKYLIKASAGIIKKHANIQFVIIGDGEERVKLEGLARGLKVSSHFKFLGNISYTQMNEYYNAADIFILPSVRDEKGNLDDQSVAVMDAMICGKPVVTSNFPGYRLVVKNGETGFLVEEKSVPEIQSVLLRLIESKTLRKRIGASARKYVLNNFSWKAIGQSYTSLFKSILQPSYSEALPIILDEKERLKKAKQIVGVLRGHLGKTENLKCLDIGCSTGVISNHLTKYFKSVDGIDVDESAIVKATGSYGRKNLVFRKMSAEDLKFRDSTYDVVIANQLYEFVDSPEKTFSEIHRVIKKGGVCFFGARNKFALMEAQYKIPFLSFLPKVVADAVIVILGRGRKFVGRYKDYWQLRRLVRKFEIHDYTISILKDPERYSFNSLARYKNLARALPLGLLTPLLPNYIWILVKK